MNNFVRIIISVMLYIILTSDVMANPEGKHSELAEDFIGTSLQSALEISRSNRPLEEIREELSALLERTIDYKLITIFVVGGKYWRQIEEDRDKEILVDNYKKYIINTYVPRFQEFSDYNMKIVKTTYKSTDMHGAEIYEVRSSLSRNPSDFSNGLNVMYLIKLLPNDIKKSKIIDIQIEEISMTVTHRSEFSDIISSKGITYFIDLLRTKNEENRLRYEKELAMLREEREEEDDNNVSLHNVQMSAD